MKLFIAHVEQTIVEKGIFQVTAESKKEAKEIIKKMPRAKIAYIEKMEYKPLKIKKIKESKELKIPVEDN